jgi:hypothetical protein
MGGIGMMKGYVLRDNNGSVYEDTFEITKEAVRLNAAPKWQESMDDFSLERDGWAIVPCECEIRISEDA